jgi:PHS family inorganic phosphate transporter-like MFS transporter
MIILACAGSLPGYWTAVLTIDTLGRKPLQIGGFIVLTILFTILGFYYDHLSEASMLTLYVIAQFFFNWGPNTTTFIVPGECFPTRYRSTGHGLSAAMGKVGAILAQVISIPLLARDQGGCAAGEVCPSPWLDRLMQIFALFMLAGTGVSLLVPETKGITLEELAGEQPYNRGPQQENRRRKWWDVFSGGQPAGFMYARRDGTVSGGASYRGGRSPRMGIMTSPELAAQMETRAQEQKGGRKRWGRRAEKERGGSSGSHDVVVGRAGSQDDGDEMPIAPASVLPGWGPAWGRGPRSGQDAGMADIRLHDVGSLLK